MLATSTQRSDELRGHAVGRIVGRGIDRQRPFLLASAKAAS
jgi:hypothetical protein